MDAKKAQRTQSQLHQAGGARQISFSAGRMHQLYDSLQSILYNVSEHQRETRSAKQPNDKRTTRIKNLETF